MVQNFMFYFYCSALALHLAVHTSNQSVVCSNYFIGFRHCSDSQFDLSQRAYERRINPREEARLASGSVNVPVASSARSYADIGLPHWAEDWGIPRGDCLISKTVLGSGRFGEVLEGAVKRGGVLKKAAIKKLGGALKFILSNYIEKKN